MAKRFTDTNKWKKKFVRELSPKHKLLWFYMLDDCNHAGIWEVDFDVASIRVGSVVNEEDLNLYGDKLFIFDSGCKCFIPDFIEFQYGELNPNSNVHRSVIILLDRYDLQEYLKSTQGLQSRLITKALDKDMVKVKDKVKRFVKPKIEEVIEYCKERGNSVDSESFFSYYESNGWKVGKNAMKSWEAAVRTWEKNEFGSKKVSQPKQVLTAWQQAREIVSNG